MNTLSFRTIQEHRGPTIELLIDGRPLGELIEAEDSLIPYYMFEGDLPQGYWGADDPSIRCVGICICGTIGCGNVECRVVREGDVVVFRDFGGCVNPNVMWKKEGGKEFRVTSVNYDSVMADIMKEVTDYQARA